jgi:hypothetical protein
MERQSYKLTIDNPCGQEWTSMTQNEIGKYCLHCSKTVVDFTTLTDAEIVQIIGQTSGKLCGRLTKPQLNRVLESNIHSNNSRFYKILAGLLLIGTAENSLATDKPFNQMEIILASGNEKQIKQECIANETPTVDSLKNLVQGEILDAQSKEPLVFASVLIKGTNTGALTDMEGKFNLIIPENLSSENITLIVSYTGYLPVEVIYNKKDLPIQIELLIITLEPVLVGEVCVEKKQRWWHFWK